MLRGCLMHQFSQVVRKRVSIFEDPQAKKRVGIATKEDKRRLCRPGDYH